MIIGSVKNYDRECIAFHPVLQKCIQYLRDTEFSTMLPGKYELDGDKIFVLVQDYMTESPCMKKSESHESYIDIQYVAEGQEALGFALASSATTVEEDLILEKDIAFYMPIEDENMITLLPGMYAVLFPWDIHKPACVLKQPSQVKKIIIKIKISEIDIK